MREPRLRRPLDAWRYLVDRLSAIAQPNADVAACDARVEALAADSLIGRALSACMDACSRAASDSVVVVAWRRTLLPLVPNPLAERVRAAGCITAVAAATTLVLRIAGTGTEPLTWILPAAVGPVALACSVWAQPIARAIARYHS
jgi:hypothetical protein